MPYIIDGHNLVPKIPQISLSDLDDEAQLIDLVRRYCLRKGVKAEIFFDRAAQGKAGRRKYGPVTAIFVRQEETADTAILRRLRGLGKAARSSILVSSDRRVQVEARALGVRVVTSGAFSNSMQRAASEGRQGGEGPAISEAEVQEWLDLFDGNNKRKDEF